MSFHLRENPKFYRAHIDSGVATIYYNYICQNGIYSFVYLYKEDNGECVITHFNEPYKTQKISFKNQKKINTILNNSIADTDSSYNSISEAIGMYKNTRAPIRLKEQHTKAGGSGERSSSKNPEKGFERPISHEHSQSEKRFPTYLSRNKKGSSCSEEQPLNLSFSENSGEYKHRNEEKFFSSTDLKQEQRESYKTQAVQSSSLNEQSISDPKEAPAAETIQQAKVKSSAITQPITKESLQEKMKNLKFIESEIKYMLDKCNDADVNLRNNIVDLIEKGLQDQAPTYRNVKLENTMPITDISIEHWTQFVTQNFIPFITKARFGGSLYINTYELYVAIQAQQRDGQDIRFKKLNIIPLANSGKRLFILTSETTSQPILYSLIDKDIKSYHNEQNKIIEFHDILEDIQRYEKTRKRLYEKIKNSLYDGKEDAYNESMTLIQKKEFLTTEEKKINVAIKKSLTEDLSFFEIASNEMFSIILKALRQLDQINSKCEPINVTKIQ
jgi:hypothetical protein